jgi:HD-GYP domain-containing protein (c-di-GMP phosphodiesterase class II)
MSTRMPDIFEAVRGARQTTNFLWHVVDGRRVSYPVEITDLKVEDSRIFIAVENKIDIFKNNEIVYLRLLSRDAVFKTKVHVINDFEVVLDFPKEILLCEKRRGERIPFHVTDEKFVKVKNVTNQALAHQAKQQKLRVLNISEDGLALFVPENLATQFPRGGQISIEALGDFWLHPVINGTIVSQKPFELKVAAGGEAGLQIGVSLNSKIPSSTYANFLVRPSLYQIDEKRLVIDSVFRDKIHENMAATLKKMEKNKKLKNIFEGIRFDQLGSDYLKIHIQLLCEVLCGVGTQVGWVSDKTMDKLIYAAYLHDVYLMEFPQLAKIQSKSELLRRQEEFTAEEQKRYLDAPAYAAELARLDSESYPDVVKMLIQQRELPDGSGFPNGTTGTHLTPLACLFIFSHYLVDYMIDNPNWTLEGFVKTYQRLLKGAYFTKIFQAIMP